MQGGQPTALGDDRSQGVGNRPGNDQGQNSAHHPSPPSLGGWHCLRLPALAQPSTAIKAPPQPSGTPSRTTRSVCPATARPVYPCHMRPASHCRGVCPATNTSRTTPDPWDDVQGFPIIRTPLAQAWPRSQKTKQNSGTTPTTCLDKTALACGTHAGKPTSLPTSRRALGYRW